MKKSDIKPGMAVELRSGVICIAVPTNRGIAFVSPCAKGSPYKSCVEFLNDDLSSNVMEGLGISKVWDVFDEDNHGPSLILNIPKGRKLLWERQETQEMTLAEIETALGHPVKIVKEK